MKLQKSFMEIVNLIVICVDLKVGFWRHPLLDDYDWYWRVEPSIDIHCDLNYDLFKYMEDNNKVYGFTISIHEFRATIPTLWDTTKNSLKKILNI